MNNSLRFLIYFVFPLSASMTGFADEKEIVDDAIFVLEQNCIVCHNAEDAKGEITLDRDPLGLDDPSLILEAIEGSDPKMPKDIDGKSPAPMGIISVRELWLEYDLS